MSKILITPYNWFPNHAGGEVYLYRLCQHLIQLGHEVKCIAYCEKPYTYGGIEVYPQGNMERIYLENNDLFEWCDLVFTQLIGTNYAHNKCLQHKKKMIFFAHNQGKHYFLTPNAKVVYNSHSLGNLFPDHELTVLQPLTNYRDYSQSTGEHIALINCNENKGVRQFIQLAEMLPQYKFMGIKGNYGKQITPEVANITWLENGAIPWDKIKILIVPSEIESWSQVATEAICCGIPVICSDLVGLRENLSYAGIYIDRNDVNSYAGMIETLMMDGLYYYNKSRLSVDRANELDPIPRVKEFNEWLLKVV